MTKLPKLPSNVGITPEAKKRAEAAAKHEKSNGYANPRRAAKAKKKAAGKRKPAKAAAKGKPTKSAKAATRVGGGPPGFSNR
jgi:hypothetical protein